MPPRKAPARNSRTTVRAPHSSHKAPHRPKKGPSKGGGAGKVFAIVGGVVALALIGLVIWWIWPSKSFDRATLDAYMELEKDSKQLNPGADVYVDFSNGMNYAYAQPVANRALRDLTNQLTGSNMDKLVKYHSLADGRIETLNMAGTQIYNRILAPESFSQEQAPIAKALAEIVKNRKPALLITDYEEYNGVGIEQHAYAKDYFVQWLSESGSIAFYKVDYVENGKPKKLFFTVFDNDGLFQQIIDQTMQTVAGQGVERFFLAGHDFFYPLYVMQSEVTYMKDNIGGNYHDAEGVDLVSAVMEKGGPQDYHRYYGNVGSALKGGKFLPLSSFDGVPAEYYPIGVGTWAEVLENVKAFSQGDVPKDKLYTHFLQGLRIGFAAQNGFNIEGIEARCFNFDKVMEAFAPVSTQYADSSDQVRAQALQKLQLPDGVEITDMFTASMKETDDAQGWYDIFVDFSQKFNGTFAGNATDKDLLRVKIVIGQATPQLALANEFFSWPGNESLAESVKNTLKTPGISPVGHEIWSYFLKISI